MDHKPAKIPIWGRLETRVIAALVLLGILCVGASAYLVQLAVVYFEEQVTDALDRGETVADAMEPFHTELIEAQIEAFEARARAIALELALRDARGDAAPDSERLQAVLERELDLVGLVLLRGDADPVKVERESVYPEDQFQWFETTAELGSSELGQLKVVFRIDPEIDARWQALGQRKRELGFERASRPEMERAVFRVIGLASALVLAISFFAGFLLARATTRKVSELSRVMARVAHGELEARARRLGRDEIGQLAAAFNSMLDELAVAQQKVAYLQRIGAWQEMARRIAHEIKNPLTPIQLAVQQIRDKDPGLSPQFSKLLATSVEIVEDEIGGLRRMVQSFSQFAKVPQVHLEAADLGRVLDEFERAYGHLTEAEDDILEVVLPDEPVRISGDRQLLKHALVNLVENAVLSVREAGPSAVQVRVVAELAPTGDWVEIRVEDNGPGIEHERRERVFEPYETTREQGTGLGLAIVKKIVLDHGGEIRIDDSSLGGAAFVIRLPIRQSKLP